MRDNRNGKTKNDKLVWNDKMIDINKSNCDQHVTQQQDNDKLQREAIDTKKHDRHQTAD